MDIDNPRTDYAVLANGGMVVRLNTPAARAYTKYLSGRHDLGRMTLYVNNSIALRYATARTYVGTDADDAVSSERCK
jgi:hypothetical protein